MDDDTLLTDDTAQEEVAGDETGQPETAAEVPAVAGQPEAAPVQPEDVVPERYEFSAADGREYDAEVLAAFEDVAREAGLSNEKANLVLGRMSEMLEARQQSQLEAARALWLDEVRADREIGGGKLPENLAVAKRALQAFGSAELTELLNRSGLGNHPEVIRMFYRAGRALSEDGMVNGNKGEALTAQSFYGNSNMNP
nr:MAG TPA: putative protease [Caudoviricetes sp.]